MINSPFSGKGHSSLQRADSHNRGLKISQQYSLILCDNIICYINTLSLCVCVFGVKAWDLLDLCSCSEIFKHSLVLISKM